MQMKGQDGLLKYEFGIICECFVIPIIHYKKFLS